MRLAVVAGDLDVVWVDEARRAAHGLDAVAGELVLEDLDLVVERHAQPLQQVVGADVLLDPVGRP